ncbi:UNVERIFIED_CONTAM: Serine/threonine-protein kinase Nek2, partial [Sesamum radiatum]
WVYMIHMQLPVSHTPARKPAQSTRRASLPLSTRAAPTSSPYKRNVGLLGSLESPDVSVNAPRIDKMVEFPLASSDDPLLPSRRSSLTSAQCSYASPYGTDRSITKDKCMVQILDRTFTRPHSAHGVQYMGSECSEHNPTSGGGSSRSSRILVNAG